MAADDQGECVVEGDKWQASGKGQQSGGEDQDPGGPAQSDQEEFELEGEGVD